MVATTENQLTKQAVAEAIPKVATRLFFVDHLRAALIILVVLHHVALVYGGISPFYYLEPPIGNLAAFVVPMIFVLLNQAWFMGALFLLAGYFTPASYDRKGPGSFIKGRLIRLGIPLLVWYFVLNPISQIGFFLMPANLTGNTTELSWQVFWQAYPKLVGLGPMWFVALLLIFCFGYVVWRQITRNRGAAHESSTPRYWQIGVFILALALASYLVRMVIPLGRSVLGFPTLAYLPQYLGFFILGTVAFRRDWLRRLPGSMGAVGFIAALVATAALFSVAFLSFLRALESGAAQFPPFGFGTWQSAVYALWDSIFAVGMVLAAITFFRRFLGGQSSFGGFLSDQSYAVYIIHIPIIVFLAYALRGVAQPPLFKFSVASLIVLTICFVAAWVIRKIPGVSKVI